MGKATPLLDAADGAVERPRGSLTGWLILSTLIGAMGAFQFGYSIGIVNVPQEVIVKAMGLDANGPGWSAIVSATPFAAIFGAQFSAGPLDR